MSCVKAEQTGLWHVAPNGTELERLSPPQIPIYDQDRIAACVEEMEANDKRWEEWFTTETINPLRITYESLTAKPIETLSKVLDHLGLDVKAASDVKPGVAKMADEKNQEWVARYRLADAVN